MRLFKKDCELYRTLKELGDRYDSNYGSDLLSVIKRLERNEEIEDEIILVTFLSFSKTIHSNCDAVAQVLLSCFSLICYYKPYLATELMVEPLRPLYYLGIESMAEIKNYMRWFTSYQEPYMGKAPQEAYNWLNEFIDKNDVIIVKAFQKMYLAEDNEWREGQPEILGGITP